MVWVLTAKSMPIPCQIKTPPTAPQKEGDELAGCQNWLRAPPRNQNV